MSEEKTFWIIAEQDTKTGKVSPMVHPVHKRMPLWWNSAEEAIEVFKTYEIKFWEDFAKSNPNSPINKYNKPWKSFLLNVKRLPGGSKYLNEKYLKKYVLGHQEFSYEAPPVTMKSLGFDGYSQSDGYATNPNDYSIDSTPESFLY
jgi:hypothetical protein